MSTPTRSEGAALQCCFKNLSSEGSQRSPLITLGLSAAATAKSLQSCPTLCNPIDGSPSGAPIPGISRQEHWSGCHFLLQCMKVKSEMKSLSHVRPSATPWTAAFQAPPSIGFSRQEYWSGVPLPLHAKYIYTIF